MATMNERVAQGKRQKVRVREQERRTATSIRGEYISSRTNWKVGAGRLWGFETCALGELFKRQGSMGGVGGV